MKVVKNSDFIGGLVIAIGTLIYFSQTFYIKKITVLNVDSAFIPRVCAVFMMILALILMVQGLLKERNKAVEETSPEQKAESYKKFKAVMTAMAILGAAIFMMEPLGFIISMVFYLMASFITLSAKQERNYLLFTFLSLVTVI